MIHITVTHKDRITGLTLMRSEVHFPTHGKAMTFLKSTHKQTVTSAGSEMKRDISGKMKEYPVAVYDTAVTIEER
tara:strand:- start:15602 stop:15826 length:225 start_codon:yes stop_codon:yes gene_type:complete